MSNPAPLEAADGTPLARREWPLAGGAAARGRVLIVHGLGEHAGRYAALAAALNGAGWQVSAYDQRGHGASGGARGVVPSPSTLFEDLARVIDAVRRPQEPLVLLGHSMGGAVAARLVAEALAPRPAPWSRAVDALVLSSPALSADLRLGQQIQLALGLKLAPNKAVSNGLKPEWISRDVAVVRAYAADPLVHDRITPRLARCILDAGDHVRATAARWRVPTLLMWAGHDLCVRPQGSSAFGAATPAGVVKLHAWRGLYHEIFNEPEREAVIAALIGWLSERGANP